MASTVNRHRSKRTGRRAGAQRTCAGCRRRLSREASIRLVIGGNGKVLPDLYGRLPGRGVHLCPDVRCLTKANETRALGRVLRGAARIEDPEELAMDLIAACERQIKALLAVSARSGWLVKGQEALERALNAGQVALVLVAQDATGGARERLENLAKARRIPARRILTTADLACYHHDKPIAYLGVVHRGVAQRMVTELDRMQQLCGSMEAEESETCGHLTPTDDCGKMPQQPPGR
jgi:predicted RNA-binding protein YlxR (DUF448 family)